eukprot:9316938-Ditylum_brightwellii.AAC.1
MDEVVHMKIEGTMAELLTKLDPKMYQRYLRNEKCKPVLYVQLKKALYGTLRAALLFWQNLSATLQEWRFEINPYDWCIANKTIDSEQCTIVCHVDDLKILHVSSKVATKIIEKTTRKIWSRSAAHREQGEDLPEEFDGEATTPAANHLFEVNNEAEKLKEEDAELFHHLVVQLLFLCKRAWPDL